MSCGCTDAARQGLGERDTERTGVCGYRPLRYSGVVTLLVVVGGEPVGGIGVPQALAAEERDTVGRELHCLGEGTVDLLLRPLGGGQRVQTAEGVEEGGGGHVTRARGVDHVAVVHGGHFDPTLPAEVETGTVRVEGLYDKLAAGVCDKVGDVGEIIAGDLDDVTHGRELQRLVAPDVVVGGLKEDEASSLAQGLGQHLLPDFEVVEEEDIGTGAYLGQKQRHGIPAGADVLEVGETAVVASGVEHGAVYLEVAVLRLGVALRVEAVAALAYVGLASFATGYETGVHAVALEAVDYPAGGLRGVKLGDGAGLPPQVGEVAGHVAQGSSRLAEDGLVPAGAPAAFGTLPAYDGLQADVADTCEGELPARRAVECEGCGCGGRAVHGTVGLDIVEGAVVAAPGRGFLLLRQAVVGGVDYLQQGRCGVGRVVLVPGLVAALLVVDVYPPVVPADGYGLLGGELHTQLAENLHGTSPVAAVVLLQVAHPPAALVLVHGLLADVVQKGGKDHTPAGHLFLGDGLALETAGPRAQRHVVSVEGMAQKASAEVVVVVVGGGGIVETAVTEPADEVLHAFGSGFAKNGLDFGDGFLAVGGANPDGLPGGGGVLCLVAVQLHILDF